MTYTTRLPSSIYEGILPGAFGSMTYRPTIGVLICINGGLLMLKSAHAVAEGYSDWWTLPQEGVLPTDGNYARAVQRCIEEELGYTPPRQSFYSAKILGQMFNKIPENRGRDGGCVKHIVFVGMSMQPFPIRLNVKENVAYKIISSLGNQDDCNNLDVAMAEVAEYRVNKYVCTCEMALRACTCGLLPWKVPKGLLEHARECA